MMYLSRLLLNHNSRQVQRETADPYNLHRTLMQAFTHNRDQSGILHRLETHPRTGHITLLVQSQAEPNWSHLQESGYLLPTDPFTPLPNPAVKPLVLALHHGQILRFRLIANPTVKRDGKRHALYKEEDQRRWLETKGTGCQEKKRPSLGFKILEMAIQKEGNQYGHIHRDNQKHKLTIHTVQYNGRLQITDTTAFTTALQQGIGPAKAFGCGLLSLAPA